MKNVIVYERETLVIRRLVLVNGIPYILEEVFIKESMVCILT